MFRSLGPSVRGAFVPDLAESREVLPDGRSIAFRLRDGFRWEDGRELTADDVVFTAERARLEDASTIAFKREIERVERAGPRDVVFHFRYHDPEMLESAVYGHVYPKHLLESVHDLANDPFNSHPVGSGPFRLENWERQQYLSFVARRDGSPGAGPYLDGIVVRIFADKNAAVRELEGGGLDLLLKVKRETAERLAARGDLVVHRAPTNGYVFVAWNSKRAPWDRAEVRQALTASIDRKALAAHFDGKDAIVAEGPVPPDHPWHDPATTSPGYDPAFAQARFASAGFRRSSDGRWRTGKGTPVRLTLLFLQGNPVLQDAAALVADSLRKAGLEVEVREMSQSALRERVEQRGDFDAAVYARPDQPVDLAGCFGPESHAENYAQLSDPELNALLEALSSETDAVRARAAFTRAARRVVELQPWTFLFYRNETLVANRRLRGIEGCFPKVMECTARWWIPKGQQ